MDKQTQLHLNQLNISLDVLRRRLEGNLHETTLCLSDLNELWSANNYLLSQAFTEEQPAPKTIAQVQKEFVETVRTVKKELAPGQPSEPILPKKMRITPDQDEPLPLPEPPEPEEQPKRGILGRLTGRDKVKADLDEERRAMREQLKRELEDIRRGGSK